MPLTKARTFPSSGVGWLREGRDHEMIAPDHKDVWLWGFEAHYGWWPLLQQQGQ